MEITHRISINSSPSIQRELAEFGVAVADHGFVSFDVEESADAWPSVEAWIGRRQAVDIASTNFSKAEVLHASWLELEPEWHHGYPQPDEDEFGYRRATYDLSDWCEFCGIGMRQNAPFQMTGEPKWGRRSILQLNWVFDEFFVTPKFWDEVFRPHGVKCRSVTNARGIELKTVVQLSPHEEVGVVTQGLPEAACPQCGRTKYLPVTRGRSPALTSEPASSMVKTNVYFGSGASADKRVLVSNALARALIASKARGAALRPVTASGR